MKKSLVLLGIGLTVCMTAVNCFAQDVSGTKAANNLNQQAQVKTIFSFKHEIALTDDQEVKLKAVLYDEQAFIDTNNNTLKALGTELGRLIANKGDMRVIKSKLEEIAKIQVETSYRNIENSRKAEMILTPDQLEKWRAIQKKFVSQSKA